MGTNALRGASSLSTVPKAWEFSADPLKYSTCTTRKKYAASITVPARAKATSTVNKTSPCASAARTIRNLLGNPTNGGNPTGFLLTTLDGQKVYIAADTGLFGDMRLIGEEGIDLAVLPIGDNYTMGPDDALRAVKMIQPKHVVPVHFNTFDIIMQDPDAWAERVEAETNTEAHVLNPGQSLTV